MTTETTLSVVGTSLSSSDSFSQGKSGWDSVTDDDAEGGDTNDDQSYDCFSLSDTGLSSIVNGILAANWISFTEFDDSTDCFSLYGVGTTADGIGCFTLIECSFQSQSDHDQGADTLTSGSDTDHDCFTDTGGGWDCTSLHQVDNGLTIDEQSYATHSDGDGGNETVAAGVETGAAETYSTSDSGWDSYSAHDAFTGGHSDHETRGSCRGTGVP